ncbi:MAG: hypothetical protein ACETWT_12115 [Thermodesulfobacteriota bacterium]
MMTVVFPTPGLPVNSIFGGAASEAEVVAGARFIRRWRTTMRKYYHTYGIDVMVFNLSLVLP